MAHLSCKWKYVPIVMMVVCASGQTRSLCACSSQVEEFGEYQRRVANSIQYASAVTEQHIISLMFDSKSYEAVANTVTYMDSIPETGGCQDIPSKWTFLTLTNYGVQTSDLGDCVEPMTVVQFRLFLQDFDFGADQIWILSARSLENQALKYVSYVILFVGNC